MNPKNHYKEWTKKELDYINESAKNGMKTENIAKNLGRTEDAVRKAASEKNIKLLPKDKK